MSGAVTLAEVPNRPIGQAEPGASLRTRHPVISGFSKYLPARTGMQLIYRQAGVPGGVPVINIPGGPGERTIGEENGFADPRKCSIFSIDHTGIGRSIPSAEVKHGEVPDPRLKGLTLDDWMDEILDVLDAERIERAVLFGGSWATVEMFEFAKRHPHRVAAIIARGVFTATEDENVRYFSTEILRREIKDGKPVGDRFNDLSLRLLARYAKINPDDPHAFTPAYRRLIVEENDRRAAEMFNAYVGYVSSLSDQDLKAIEEADGTHIDPEEFATNFFSTKFFTELPQQRFNLLGGLEVLRAIPIYIIQGEQDRVCPRATAADPLIAALRAATCEVHVTFVPEGHHSPFEPHMTDALMRSLEDAVSRYPMSRSCCPLL